MDCILSEWIRLLKYYGSISVQEIYKKWMYRRVAHIPSNITI